MITEPGLGLTVRQLNHGDERWNIISSVSVKSNKTDTGTLVHGLIFANILLTRTEHSRQHN